MTLNKNQLRTDLLTMMNAAKSDPDWTEDRTARELSDAIDRFVRTGVVRDVRVEDDHDHTLRQIGEVTVR